MHFVGGVGKGHIHISGPRVWDGPGYAPEPTELVPMGLGACACALIQNWLDEVCGWSEGYDFAVSVAYDKHASHGLYNFHVIVETDEAKLLDNWKHVREVVEKCPVYKTLADKCVGVTIRDTR